MHFSRLHPAFIDSTADVARQFVIIGTVSVALNTAANVIATHWAATRAWPSGRLPFSKCDRYLVQLCARRDLHFELHCLLRGGLVDHPGVHSVSCGLSYDVAAQSFGLLLGKVDAIYEDHGVHTSFASDRASLKGVDVQHVGDRFAPSP